MAGFDRIKKLIDDNEEKIDGALDKAGDFAKSKVKGHDDKIDKAVDKAQDLTGRKDDGQPQP